LSEEYEDYKRIVDNFVKEENTQLVSLSDKICVGCNGCGDCCIAAQVKVNAYDIYNMLKHTSQKELSSNLVFYFGDNSHLPLILLKNKSNDFCPFVKNTNGDFECILGNDKPTLCYNNFIAVSIKFDDLSFVPFDQEVQPLDIDKLYEKYKIENNMIIYLKDRNEKKCPAPKTETTVKEYIKGRLVDEKERLLATVLPMLLNKYIEPEKFQLMIYLSENSKLNIKNPFNHVFNGKDNETYDKIMKSMFLELYLFADPEEDKDFMTKIKNQIESLEKGYFSKLRVLYKYLLKVFDPNDYFFNELCKLDDINKKQEMYDKYCETHAKEISESFLENAVDMLTEFSGKIGKETENAS
jgi:Fe-S-cluster containining protein